MKKLKKSIFAFIALSLFTGGGIFLGCSSDSSSSSSNGGDDDNTELSEKITNDDGTTTLNIQENGSGFVSTTGSINTTETKWIGYSNGFIENLISGTSVVYTVSASEAIADAKIAIHYANWQSGNTRGAYVYVNGTLVNENNPISMTYTNKGTQGQVVDGRWIDSGYLTSISLNQGNNSIVIEGAPADTYTTFVPTANDTANSLTSLEVNNDGQLSNIDYLIVVGKGIDFGTDKTPYYTLSYSSENSTAGSVTSETSNGSVKEGTSVTLTATANSGWKFECWTDGTTSNPYTFTVSGNKYVMAHFVPESYTAPSGLVGYATVTSDSAASYTITGGAGGETITISSLSDMESNKDKLSSDTPYIVKVTGTVTTSDNVSVYYTIGSNKTLYSADGSGRFKNVEVRVEGENVIIRNLKFGEVIGDDFWGGSGNDALALNGATHVWVDHCEFQSHLTPQNNADDSALTYSSSVTNATTEEKWAKDFYDGLLDIKNGSTWITISNCYLHDHWKAVLCASGDSKADTNTTTGATDEDMRLTFYGNYFYNINSRQPLFRWGKAHLFNNYFNSPSTSSDTYQQSNCIDVRIDSQVLAEANYFSGVKNAIGLDLANGGSDSTGSAGYSFPSSNTLSSCKNTPSSSGGSYSYTVPYSYSDSMTTASTNPATNAGANLTSLSY